MSDPDEQFIMCTECKGIQPFGYVENSAFGMKAPCKFCGGAPMTIVTRANKEKVSSQIDTNRNIGHDPDINHG